MYLAYYVALEIFKVKTATTKKT